MSRRVHFKRISTPNLNELDNSDRIRICCLVTNGILIASALAVILSILAVYVHRSWLRLISALHSIISANVTLGFLLAVSVVSILLGCIGLYTIRKRSTLTHGLQVSLPNCFYLLPLMVTNFWLGEIYELRNKIWDCCANAIRFADLRQMKPV